MENMMEDFPAELLLKIFSFLRYENEVDLRLVCSAFNEVFDHPYSLNWYKGQYEHVLDKYVDLQDLPYGIFKKMPKLKRNLEMNDVSEIRKRIKMILSLKLIFWGNHKRNVCGVGLPLRNISKEPEIVNTFPQGEIIWFIAHSHERLTVAISLSARMYSWGDNPCFSDMRNKASPVPITSNDFNNHLENNGELPIYASMGHEFAAFLTHKGNVYVCEECKVPKKINVEGRFVNALHSTSFYVAMVYIKQNESPNMREYGVSSYGLFSNEGHDTECVIKMKHEDEYIVRMKGGYRSRFCLTNKNRLCEIMPPNCNYYENVIDVSSAYTTLVVLENGDVYGEGSNRDLDLGGVYDKSKSMVGTNGVSSFFYCKGLMETMKEKYGGRKIVEVSNGTDYSSSSGHTLFMDEEGKFLYHMGGNYCGEHLCEPVGTTKHPPEILEQVEKWNILVFKANENYCSAIVY